MNKDVEVELDLQIDMLTSDDGRYYMLNHYPYNAEEEQTKHMLRRDKKKLFKEWLAKSYESNTK